MCFWYFKIIVCAFLFLCTESKGSNAGDSTQSADTVHSNISSKDVFDARVKYALGADIFSSLPRSSLKNKKTDCEGLVHFIHTGEPAHYEEGVWKKKTAYTVNPLTATHQPYTGYFLLDKQKDYMRETKGEFGFVHAFIVTGDGRYLSRNGLCPIRIFNSYQDMLITDGFPFGFVDENGYPIKKPERYPDKFVGEDGRSISYQEGMIPKNAVVGECVIFSLNDVTGDMPRDLTEDETEIFEYKNETGK